VGTLILGALIFTCSMLRLATLLWWNSTHRKVRDESIDSSLRSYPIRQMQLWPCKSTHKQYNFGDSELKKGIAV
jgi:hypothetical protein